MPFTVFMFQGSTWLSGGSRMVGTTILYGLQIISSPHQLFVEQSLHLQRSGLVALDFFEQVNSNYSTEEGLVVRGQRFHRSIFT